MDETTTPAQAAVDPARRMLGLEQPILDALWDVVHQPVGGDIEDYDADGNVIARRVSPDVLIIDRIRAEYVGMIGNAFEDMVDRLGVLVQSMGAKPTAGKGYDDHGSAFTTFVYEVLKTMPLDLQIHGVRRIEEREGHWGAINQATYRALASYRVRRQTLVDQLESPPIAVKVKELFEDAERVLNLTPEQGASMNDRYHAIWTAVMQREVPSDPAELAAFNAVGKVALRATSAYRQATIAARRASSYGVQWNGPEKKWCLVAYGVTPPTCAFDLDL